MKFYILLALIIAVFPWLFLKVWRSLNGTSVRAATFIGSLFVLTPFLYIYGANLFARISNSVFSLLQNALAYQWWHEIVSGGNKSFYSLGDFDLSFWGICQKIPAAINVALFRPYFTELTSPITLIAAVESFSFLLLTVYVLVRTGLVRTTKIVLKNEALLSFLLFVLILAFITGFTSYNFGALSRYKIPLLPFFLAFLLVVYRKGREAKGYYFVADS